MVPTSDIDAASFNTSDTPDAPDNLHLSILAMSGSAASVDTLTRPDSRAKAADVGDRRQTIDGFAPGKDLCRESAVFADP